MILSRQTQHRLMVGTVAAQYAVGVIAYCMPGFDTFNYFKLACIDGHLFALGLSIATVTPVWWRDLLRTGVLWLITGPALVPMLELAYLRLSGGYSPPVGIFSVGLLGTYFGLTLVLPLLLQSGLHAWHCNETA